MNTSASQLDLKTLMDIHRREIFTNLHCHKLGTIQEFDPEAQTATISINHKADVGGVITDYPMLYEVPVFVPAGGGGVLTMPIAKGDSCLVLFSDRDIGTWLSQGYTDAVPPTRRKHNIADGLAIVGFRPKTNPVSDYKVEDAELRCNGAYVTVNSKVSIRTDGENLKALLEDLLSALAGWVNTDNSTPNSGTISKLAEIKNRIPNLLK